MAEPPDKVGARRLRVAAPGDVHCSEQHREEIGRSFRALAGAVDLVLLAGDLTNHGEPEEAAVLADACAGLAVPVFAVLGNHDWHVDRRDELVEVLEAGRVRVLDRETSVDVEPLDRGLREIAACPIRIVLMHYAPTVATIAGEPEGIWAFLGTDRLAAPIAAHEPDLVLHGHAHAGTFEGAIGEVPVYNVSVPVMGRDFWRFELEARSAGRTSIH